MTLGAALLLRGHCAHADDTAAAAAQLLFEQGRDLLRAGQYVEACPPLAESQRLDPATGTLLALAMCHEGEGKLASAWAEFSGVVGLARRDGHLEREQLARQRAADLKFRVSTLELRVPARSSRVAGFELRRNGLLLGKDSWDLPIPVDGGSYEIVATAPGSLPWKTELKVDAALDRVVVSVPELESQASPVAAPPREPAPSLVVPTQGLVVPVQRESGAPPAPSAAHPATDSGWSTWQWTGVAATGAGAIALAAGGYFMFQALELYDRAAPHCDADGCVEPGFSDRQDGQRYGDYATVFAVGGAALAASGAALFFWGGHNDEPRNTVALRFGPERVGIHFHRLF